MHDLEYFAPSSLGEVWALAESANGRARYLAGGTDLLLALERESTRGEAGPRRLIDLKRIPGLDRIEALPGGGWRIGALATMAAIVAHDGLGRALPALVEGARFVGGPAIRNRATLGGNLCNASPAADTATPLLVLNARAVLAGKNGSRELPLAKFWKGPRQTALAPGVLLAAIVVPPLPAGSAMAFQRITRTAMDIALVNAAAFASRDAQGKIIEARLALGAVAPTAIAVDLTPALAGRAPDEGAWLDAAKLARAAARPIDDVRASARYRRDMVGVLAARALEAAARSIPGASR